MLMCLALVGTGVVAAQTYVREPHQWIVAKRLTVETQADIAGDLTADTATFTTLVAPTVTMTSATTWTVASLTATALQATDGTITTGTVTALTAATTDAGALTASGAVINGTLDVDGASTLTGTVTTIGNAAVGGALGVTGASTLKATQINGNAAVTGTFTIGSDFSTTGRTYFIPPDAFDVVDGGVITVTDTIMELTSTGNAGAEMVAPTDGQVAILVNTGSDTITISETVGTVLSGDAALGAGDTLMLVGVGVVWYEVAQANN
jgi:cytoskeletal protein CcmA (bactofilin family)